jgi:hypothetical protein
LAPLPKCRELFAKGKTRVNLTRPAQASDVGVIPSFLPIARAARLTHHPAAFSTERFRKQ